MATLTFRRLQALPAGAGVLPEQKPFCSCPCYKDSHQSLRTPRQLPPSSWSLCLTLDHSLAHTLSLEIYWVPNSATRLRMELALSPTSLSPSIERMCATSIPTDNPAPRSFLYLRDWRALCPLAEPPFGLLVALFFSFPIRRQGK